MNTSFGPLRRAMMGVPLTMATGFSAGDTPTWKHLETAVLAAVDGYHAVLLSSRTADLVPRLDRTPLELRSYAYEGAAMGLTAMDCFLPGKRLAAYIAGPGAPHVYMVHIGAGEALARLRRKPEPYIAKVADRVLCWLVMDGYGFHRGFFDPKRYVDRQHVPGHLSAYARRVFDQGVGRSVWFTAGAKVPRVVDTIGAFPAHRHADLWLGIGVACAYVGGAPRGAIEQLARSAGRHAPQLAVGTAFVVKGRTRAGNPAPHTDLARAVLCDISAEQAVGIVDAAFEDLPVDGPEPAYALLQKRISAQFSVAEGAVS